MGVAMDAEDTAGHSLQIAHNASCDVKVHFASDSNPVALRVEAGGPGTRLVPPETKMPLGLTHGLDR